MAPFLAWRGAAGDEAAALGGALSAQVVDAIHGAPDLLAFGADAAVLDRIETLSARVDALDRRQAPFAIEHIDCPAGWIEWPVYHPLAGTVPVKILQRIVEWLA